MSYFENVAAGGLALKRGDDSNWELARLTYENTTEGGGRPRGDRVTMDIWCRDVREAAGRSFSKRTGELYKRIWVECGQAVTPHVGAELPPFTDAYDRVRGGSSVDRFVAWGADNVVKQGTPETKIETFRRLAEDPDVRADKQAQSAALDFGVQVYRQREQDVRAHWRQDEVAEATEERIEEIGTALDLEALCDQFLRAARNFETQLGPLLEKDRPPRAPLLRLRSSVRRIREACDRLDGWIEDGRSDVDTFVASVLHPEGQR